MNKIKIAQICATCGSGLVGFHPLKSTFPALSCVVQVAFGMANGEENIDLIPLITLIG
jgi:hypothetical protein